MRKRTLRYVLALIVLSLLLPISVYASSLTDAQVRKFVSSWSDVTTLLLDDAYDESEDAYGAGREYPDIGTFTNQWGNWSY